MAQATRMKPPMGIDNAWWWEMADRGSLGIQRCLGCSELRHPPRPLCDKCHCEEWDAIESSGRGTIFSFTILTHPKFPGYDYPLIIVLVELEEGTRITSQLVDCDPEQVAFGQAVDVIIQQDPDGFKIPVFKLRESS